MIVEGFKSKAELQRHVAAGHGFSIIDPSLFSPPYGNLFDANDLPEGAQVVATNHPKRSWFATISKRNGKVVVK